MRAAFILSSCIITNPNVKNNIQTFLHITANVHLGPELSYDAKYSTTVSSSLSACISPCGVGEIQVTCLVKSWSHNIGRLSSLPVMERNCRKKQITQRQQTWLEFLQLWLHHKWSPCSHPMYSIAARPHCVLPPL